MKFKNKDKPVLNYKQVVLTQTIYTPSFATITV